MYVEPSVDKTPAQMKERYKKSRPNKANRDGLMERVEGLLDKGKLYEETESGQQPGRQASGSIMPDYFDFYNKFRSSPEDVEKAPVPVHKIL
jgi:hypothetical protein